MTVTYPYEQLEIQCCECHQKSHKLGRGMRLVVFTGQQLKPEDIGPLGQGFHRQVQPHRRRHRGHSCLRSDSQDLAPPGRWRRRSQSNCTMTLFHFLSQKLLKVSFQEFSG